jgi:single-strand DNA-binding protein
VTATAISGHLADDPITATDRRGPYTRFTVCHTPRVYHRARDRWVDGETVVLPVLARGPLAERAAGTLRATERVMVIGELRSRNNTVEIDAREIGVPLSALPTPSPPRSLPASAPRPRTASAE